MPFACEFELYGHSLRGIARSLLIGLRNLHSLSKACCPPFGVSVPSSKYHLSTLSYFKPECLGDVIILLIGVLAQRPKFDSNGEMCVVFLFAYAELVNCWFKCFNVECANFFRFFYACKALFNCFQMPDDHLPMQETKLHYFLSKNILLGCQ